MKIAAIRIIEDTDIKWIEPSQRPGDTRCIVGVMHYGMPLSMHVERKDISHLFNGWGS